MVPASWSVNVISNGTPARIFAALRLAFHAICTEMEGAAIAHTAFVNEIPFIVLRAISDKADEEADVTYETFEHQAAENCAKVVAYMVAKITSGL